MSELHTATHPVANDSVTGHPLFRSRNRLKLATFCWNLQSGNTATLAEGPIGKLDWAQQVRLARKSEALGFDAIVPVGVWKGMGPNHFWEESYETITWAAALAGVTSRVAILSTVHVPILHPVRAAKSAVTIDHASGGRFGFNITAGWNDAEFSMFGHNQLPHDERYDQAEEWVNFVKKLWTEEKPFDFNGKYYQAPAAHGAPGPLGTRPLLMSAGSSKAGQAFAAKNADLIFIAGPTSTEQARETIESVRSQAAAHGREVQIWTTCGMVCAPTEAEAQRIYDYYVRQNGDWETAEILVRNFLGGGAESFLHVDRQKYLEGAIAWTYGHQLIGTPEQVVEKMAALADAGLDGTCLSWFNPEEGLEIFERDIRPLARQAGLMAR